MAAGPRTKDQPPPPAPSPSRRPVLSSRLPGSAALARVSAPSHVTNLPPMAPHFHLLPEKLFPGKLDETYLQRYQKTLSSCLAQGTLPSILG